MPGACQERVGAHQERVDYRRPYLKPDDRFNLTLFFLINEGLNILAGIFPVPMRVSVKKYVDSSGRFYFSIKSDLFQYHFYPDLFPATITTHLYCLWL